MTHGLFPHLLLLSAFCGASLSCSSPSRDITIRSIPSGASLRVNGDYAGQAPVTLSLNRHKPVHVAADKPGFLSTEKTFYPEMTTQGAILWGRNNEKSKDFKTDILTDFCEYNRHTGILTYGDIKFLCGAEIIAQAAHYILWHAVRFIFGAVFYKLGKVVRQKFIGFYTRAAYSLGYEGDIYLTHRVYPP